MSRVLAEFAKYVFAEQIRCYNQNNNIEISIYDYLYQVIIEEIAKHEKVGPVLVSWLTAKEREQALRNLKKHPIPTDISFINDPFDQPMPKYETVNYEYFSNNSGKFNAVLSGSSRKRR